MDLSSSAKDFSPETRKRCGELSGELLSILVDHSTHLYSYTQNGFTLTLTVTPESEAPPLPPPISPVPL
eukprot:CAMPEP_0177674726 /NCGR_PEP_ID=MMETSP0447-20121125/26751_1 /TAXON_ID=0 /ORGANISM="Stygamoeba regulata, Strain BSH-02190019" /LENGTH=68 /DNA_ID=CAMNT_0019182925 /DNA_START=21 /DNA_END=224 /DNA_ORIENTATION=-